MIARIVFAHVQTCRPYTLAYPGLVGLAGVALAGGPHLGWNFFVAWAAPTLGWASAHYLGDYFDRDLDAISKPQRPIPSGRLSPRAAVITGVGCAVAALLLGLLTNWHALVLTVVAMGGIIGYSRVFKARGVWGNLMRGALTAVALMFGALTPHTEVHWSVLLFALALCLHDASSNVVGALRDVTGDRAGAYHTLPVRIGTRGATQVALTLYAGALATAALAIELVPFGQGPVVLLTVAAGCGAGAFIQLIPPFTARQALRAHEVLVAERLVLTSAVLACGLGFVAACAVLVPLLVVSVLLQRRMRARHEFPGDRSRDAVSC